MSIRGFFDIEEKGKANKYNTHNNCKVNIQGLKIVKIA